MKKNISRERFLQSVRETAEYWGGLDLPKEQVAKGVAFSIMCLLDGVCTNNLYGYRVIDNGTGQDISTAFKDGRELHADL